MTGCRARDGSLTELWGKGVRRVDLGVRGLVNVLFPLLIPVKFSYSFVEWKGWVLPVDVQIPGNAVRDFHCETGRNPWLCVQGLESGLVEEGLALEKQEQVKGEHRAATSSTAKVAQVPLKSSRKISKAAARAARVS